MNRFAPKVAELHGHIDSRITSPEATQPLTEAQLNELDRVAGVELPRCFREYLRDYHAYTLGTDETSIRARNGDLFCSWHYNGWTQPDFFAYSGWPTQLAPHFGDWAPANLRTIGGDGNLAILLAVDGATLGSVFLWDPMNDGSYAHITLLARSFEQFFFSLELVDAEEEHPGEQREKWPIVEELPPVPVRHTAFDSQMQEARYAYVLLGEEPRIATEADLARVERAINRPLPPDYRQFLQHYGACGIKDLLFYAAFPDDRYDIVMQLNREENTKGLPICGSKEGRQSPVAWLVLEGENAGSIEFCTRAAFYSNYLADSFTDFLNYNLED